MRGRIVIAAVLMGLGSPAGWSRTGEYEPAYDQPVEGYGVGTLDERVAKLEKRLSGDAMAEMLNRIERLQTEVRGLHGQVEELTHALETARKRQQDMYTDLEQRLQAGAAATQPPATDAAAAPGADAAPPPTVPAPPVPVAAPATPKPTPAPPSEAELRQAAYQKAFNTLKDGKYPEAVREFKSFLAAYSSGEYVDMALYWQGESYYVLRDFPSAREAFRKLLKNYPQSGKAADAQLRLGYIEYDAGQWAKAREQLAEVNKSYPGSSAAKAAEKRLAKMKQEGH